LKLDFGWQTNKEGEDVENNNRAVSDNVEAATKKNTAAALFE
jgi:chaperone required for assembly of F1-ATPase